MTTTQPLGFDIIATDKTGQAFASVKRLTDQIVGAQNALRSYGAPMAQAAGVTARFGGRIQNASYQIADFAVQVGSGTDATRALAQQVPQVLSGLGMFGAIAGAAVAIAVPLAQAFGTGRDYAKELADGTEKLNAALKLSRSTLADLTEEYGRHAGVIRSVARTQEELARSDIARALRDQAREIVDLNSAYVGTAGFFGEIANQLKNADFGRSAIAQLFSPLDEAANKVNFLKDKFSLTDKAARALERPFFDFQSAVNTLNTDGAALALRQFSEWIDRNAESAKTALPLLDDMRRTFEAISRGNPRQEVTSALKGDFGSLGMPGETEVFKRGGFDSEAFRAAADAAKRAAAQFKAFTDVVANGVTPLQHLRDTLREAQANFARFGEKMNPDQIAAYKAYVSDLDKKIEDLTFKEKWDKMAQGIQAGTEALTPFRDMLEAIGQGVEDSFVNGLADAFTSFVDGTASAKEALQDFAASFARELSAMIAKALILFAVQKLIGLATGSTAFGSLTQSYGGVYGSGLLNGVLGSADGNVFSGGRVVPFASGGIVSSPTLFPMRGGGIGLMGEAGAEAIVPLSRRNGKLGVGASPVYVNVNNYAGTDVRTRQRADGGLDIDILEKELAGRVARGGSPLGQSFEAAFGARRRGR